MKYIPLFILVFICYFLLSNVVAKNTIIPDDAIRVRVIANSNSDYDQEMKKKVKDKVQIDMYNLLKNTNGSNNAKKIINSNLNLVSSDIKEVLDNNNYNLKYDVNYGKNYFPEKKYRGVTYKEGYYDSLVVTLGEGKGDNWWCVLFPPLCLLEADDSHDVKYTTAVNEMVDKYLK